VLCILRRFTLITRLILHSARDAADDIDFYFVCLKSACCHGATRAGLRGARDAERVS